MTLSAASVGGSGSGRGHPNGKPIASGQDAEISRDEGERLYGSSNQFLYPGELPQKSNDGSAVKTRKTDQVLSSEEISLASRLPARASLLTILFLHDRHLRIRPEFPVIVESQFDIFGVGLE